MNIAVCLGIMLSILVMLNQEQRKLQSLEEEMKRLKVDTVLLIFTQSYEDLPRWSPEGSYLAFNTDGTWRKIDLSQVALDPATWRRGKRLGVMVSEESISETSVVEVKNWRQFSKKHARKIRLRNNTTLELRLEGLSTAFIVTPKGQKAKIYWRTGLENCHTFIPSPDERYIVFISEMNGIVLFKVP